MVECCNEKQLFVPKQPIQLVRVVVSPLQLTTFDHQGKVSQSGSSNSCFSRYALTAVALVMFEMNCSRMQARWYPRPTWHDPVVTPREGSKLHRRVRV